MRKSLKRKTCKINQKKKYLQKGLLMLKAFNLIDGIANKYTVLPTVYQHLKYNSDK